ncbi:MAG: hypothetical protein IPJ32_02985 [Sphingobacteriaceae bacterium]|nr:hypothetical protein [Sphingobacteriaceae bacterium]
MKKIFILLVLSFLSALCYSQVITPFAVKKQLSQKGGIVYLSNVALSCNANPPSAGGTCQTGANEVPPAGAMQDNDYNAAYVDIDGDAATFMSSRDVLTLPSCSEISWAGLFWGASRSTTLATGFTSIKIKANSGSYQTVTAANSQTNTTGFNTYHCFADVTNFMKTAGINATVTVADIFSDQIGVANRFGSWTMVIMYRNDLQNMRQLTCFEGLANVSGTSTVNIPISGFLTPLSGPVTFEAGVYVHDGDRGAGFTGDNLNFNGGSGFVALTNAINPANDVMNSTCSRNGTLTPNRTPNMNNTGGLDADIYFPNNVPKNYLGNSVTSATFQITTGGETYLPQFATTAIDIYEPDLRASIKARDVNGGTVMPGDVIEYRIKGINIGSDPSVNTFLLDSLEANANYIPNSTSIIYGPNTGAKTDVSGDDQVDYFTASRILKIRIGTGANAATGGTVINSPAGIDSTIVTFSVTATQSCAKLLCDNVIDARAYILGTGAVSTNTFSNGSNPGIFDAFGCPIPGTTSTPITSTACATPTAANTSPVCSASSLTLSSSNDTEATYSWSGPSSFTSAVQNPTIGSVGAANAGVYTVTLSVTGYTCQYTASTTVSVNVLCPTAVNDATNTVLNTPVTGSVGLNDINATGGTFSNGQPTPGSGTLTMNPSTGQYTYTPATGFTGTTSATYTLCNGLPLVCSSATITFTVYPNIVANTNSITTAVNTATTGNLTTNDVIPAGVNINVSVTQPAPTTGTITVNPTTGQYTFTPNPAFTGSASTTYTVCNTTVNPSQCSNTTIVIYVGTPVAVSNTNTTMQNTPVSGNAGTNDGGTNAGLSPVFTNSQPTAGTGTLNCHLYIV